MPPWAFFLIPSQAHLPLLEPATVSLSFSHSLALLYVGDLTCIVCKYIISKDVLFLFSEAGSRKI